ncbi:MAG: ATP-dependent DNA ligase [Candidatus Sumerlaeaceae bacterium]
MALKLKSDLAPMESKSVREIPTGDNWLYEPKWDGFRCLAFRDGRTLQLQSKAGQPLARYFPEVVTALLALKAKQFVLDGEIVVPEGSGLSFNKLLQRLHPAASRVNKLSVQTPALLIVFDLLAGADGKSLLNKPLQERRELLEDFAKKYFATEHGVRLSPATREYKQAQKWFGAAGAALDGIMAKRLDEPYHSGDREGMVKVKPVRTAECVVGGFRYASGQKVIGSLLLGLYDESGLLHHIGFCSALKAPMRKELTPKLENLIKAPGFTGSAPGGPSRWATERSGEWQPLDPKLVVEVDWDHFTNGRFRHGTKFVRFRPDKSPKKCTMEQVQLDSTGATELLNR